MGLLQCNLSIFYCNFGQIRIRFQLFGSDLAKKFWIRIYNTAQAAFLEYPLQIYATMK
jgi:hypothetical protein